jgi:hypothetical protein
MAAKEAVVTCPYKGIGGYCCHRDMYVLKTSPRVLCPFKNIKKCRLYQRSIKRQTEISQIEPFREDIRGGHGQSFKFNQKVLQRPFKRLFEGFRT